jgi:hypothetical protein
MCQVLTPASFSGKDQKLAQRVNYTVALVDDGSLAFLRLASIAQTSSAAQLSKPAMTTPIRGGL